MSAEQIREAADNIRLQTLQDHLRSSTHFHKTVALRARCGVMDTESRRIIFTTPALDELFGYLPGELLGQPIHILVPTLRRPKHIDHVDGYCGGPMVRMPMSTRIQDLEGQTKRGETFPAGVDLDPFVEIGTSMVLFTVMAVAKRRDLP